MSKAESGSGSVSWGRPARGLRLGVAAEAGLAELHLQNVGDAPLEVLSHVKAHEKHFDWFGLSLKDAAGATRRLRLLDDRDKSGTVRARLEPGESLRHSIDVGDWASRPVNGAEPLAPGAYLLNAEYEVDSARDYALDTWSGRLEAGPVTLAVG